MTEPRIVTREEFEKFILDQPDDKRLNFDNHYVFRIIDREGCNCPMIDFGKSIDLKFNYCTTKQWFGVYNPVNTPVAKFENGLSYNDYGVGHFAYGSLKRAVIQRRNSVALMGRNM